ncbi:MAG: recombinase family protein [Acidimicrobiia bacterium]|nr:recombinase family protein [Acidimicrobiia bacterium]
MRVVGYVREALDPQEGDPSFSQSEKIRRWTADNGHQLISVCQDLRTPGRDLGRDGLRAMIGIISAGQVEAVVVSALNVFSPDKIVQEVMIDDLRARGVAVLTAEESEHELLEDPSPDQVRLLVRDVLEKARRHRTTVGESLADPSEIQVDEASDVIVELVAPRNPEIANLPRSS